MEINIQAAGEGEILEFEDRCNQRYYSKGKRTGNNECSLWNLYIPFK